MSALWADLPVLAQDILWTLLLLLPALVVGIATLRGYAPWPLVRAILWRFRWPAAMFVLLIAISVGMGIGLLAQERGLRRGTAQAADKFDQPWHLQLLMLVALCMRFGAYKRGQD